jgi:hypothetical protein
MAIFDEKKKRLNIIQYQQTRRDAYAKERLPNDRHSYPTLELQDLFNSYSVAIMINQDDMCRKRFISFSEYLGILSINSSILFAFSLNSPRSTLNFTPVSYIPANRTRDLKDPVKRQWATSACNDSCTVQ